MNSWEAWAQPCMAAVAGPAAEAERHRGEEREAHVVVSFGTGAD